MRDKHIKKTSFKPFDVAGEGKPDAGMAVEMGGREHRVNPGWYRGETTNFLPVPAVLSSSEAFDRYLLHGWIPSKPFITAATKIVTFGSCFAGNIARYLGKAGYDLVSQRQDAKNVFLVACNEGIVNTFTMRQMFEWVFDGKRPSEPVWHGYQAEQFSYGEDERQAAKAIFDQGTVFIVTVGLSEVWFNKETGEVFSRAIPKDAYDPKKHGFRVSTVAENLANLQAIVAMLRKHRPKCKIILTLSPIPLLATFRPVSCVTANSVSKAVLRSALDELMREPADDLYYWPSYEMVMHGFTNSFLPDGRHVKPAVLTFIMRSFEAHYAKTGDNRKRNIALISALTATGAITPQIKNALLKGRVSESLRLMGASKLPYELRRNLIATIDHPKAKMAVARIGAALDRQRRFMKERAAKRSGTATAD